MPLQRARITFPIGAGLSEGANEKLVDGPNVIDAHDVRIDKQGEYVKRTGETETGSTGLAAGRTPQCIHVHGDQLLQDGSDGLYGYDSVNDKWYKKNEASPRPATCEVFQVARGNGSYVNGDAAYSSDYDIVCVVYQDLENFNCRAAWYNGTTKELITDTYIGTVAANHLMEKPRVVYFDTTFVVFGVSLNTGVLWAGSYDPGLATDYTFGNFANISNTDVVFDYDVYVEDPGDTACHVAIAKDLNGFKAYTVSSAPAVTLTQSETGVGELKFGISIVAQSAQSKVFVAYPRNTGGAGPEMYLSHFADTYGGTGTATNVKVFDFEEHGASGPATGERHCTLEVADTASGNMFIAASHVNQDGLTQGGIDFALINTAGAVVSSSQNFVPNLSLVTHAWRDSLDRIIIGVARDIDTYRVGPDGDNTAYHIDHPWVIGQDHSYVIKTAQLAEPLPAGWFIALHSRTVTSAGSFDGETYTPGATSTEYGFGAVARFGHDLIDLANFQADASGATVAGRALSTVADLGSGVYFAPYAVAAGEEPDSMISIGQASRTPIIAHGIDCALLDVDPQTLEESEAQDLLLRGAGIYMSYDAQRAVEGCVPFVPLPPWREGDDSGTNIDGAPGDQYTNEFPQDEIELLAGRAIDVSGSPSDYHVEMYVRHQIVWRWMDSQGNIHRSSPSEISQWEYPVYAGSGGAALMQATTVGGGAGAKPTPATSHTMVIHKPSFTALNGEDAIWMEVELYHDLPTVVAWELDTTTATIKKSVLDVIDLGSEMKLAERFRITPSNDITVATVPWPNAYWIEESATSPADSPKPEAPLIYTAGGELPAEPPPCALDIAATQKRVFLLAGEDPLAVWYSKPLVPGYAPEFNTEQQLRIGAEGGKAEAIEVMDDKLIILKRNKVYLTHVLSGPDANGNGADFPPPRELASDTGCIDRKTVVSGPHGVDFLSSRGAFRVTRDLRLQFIGDHARGLDSATTHAGTTVVPETSEIVWSYDNKAYVWNYLRDAWTHWKNVHAIDVTTWRGHFTRLIDDGTVRYDPRTAYAGSFGITRPLLDVKTPWIKLAGIQGYQRVYRIYVLGEHITGSLKAEIRYDYNDSLVDTISWTHATLNSIGSVLQLEIMPSRPLCQAIQLRIVEDTVSGSTGEGFKLQSIDFEVGVHQNLGWKNIGSTAKG